MKTITQSFKIIALALILSLGVSYVSAWTAPTVAPTGGNTASPLNTSVNNQFKGGTITLTRTDAVQGFEAYGTTLLATITGNVGIGTTAPGAKLEVAGNILQQNGNTLQAKNSAGTAETWMWPRWSDNIMYTNFGVGGWNIRNNSSSNVMFLQSDGNVGIGTTAPYGKLTIGTGASAVSTGQTDVTTGAWIRNDGANTVMSTNTGNMYYGWGGSNKNLYFYSGGTVTPALTIDTTDRVGMGTATPSNILDIATTPTGSNTGISLNGKVALTASAADTWLRLNNGNQFASGVYTPGNMTADGGFSTTWTVAPPAGGVYIGSSLKFNELGSAGDVACSSVSDSGRVIYVKESAVCTWRGCALGGFSKKYRTYFAFCHQVGTNSVGYEDFGVWEWYEGAYGDSACTSGPVYC